jgi:hypothetical protein
MIVDEVMMGLVNNRRIRIDECRGKGGSKDKWIK